MFADFWLGLWLLHGLAAVLRAAAAVGERRETRVDGVREAVCALSLWSHGPDSVFVTRVSGEKAAEARLWVVRWAHRSFLLDFSPQNNLNSFPTKRMSVVWYSKDYARRNLRSSWSVEGYISIFLTDLFRRWWGSRCCHESPLLKHRLTKVKTKNRKAKISCFCCCSVARSCSLRPTGPQLVNLRCDIRNIMLNPKVRGRGWCIHSALRAWNDHFSLNKFRKLLLFWGWDSFFFV